MTHYQATRCADAIIADAESKAAAAGLTPSESHCFIVSRLRSELVSAFGCIDDKYQAAAFLRITEEARLGSQEPGRAITVDPTRC